MKIVVWEWNLASLGGRQRTMLAFADCLKLMGHHVTVVTNWLIPEGRTGFDPANFLYWDLCTTLTPADFLYVAGMQRQLTPDTVPSPMKEADLILVSYGELGHVQQLVSCPVVAWVIHPAQTCPKGLRQIWTNSETTLARLRETVHWRNVLAKIIIPPHDYTVFRFDRVPWSLRAYDLCAVGTLVHDKGLIEAAQLAEDMGLTIAIVGRTQPHNMRFSRQIAQEICRTSPNVTYLEDIPREEVARVMGMSRVYLSLSRDESCSLAIYEAMAAGCHVVGRNVGAIQEQLGGTGCIFDTQIDAQLGVKAALSLGGPSKASMERSLKFDRQVVAGTLREALREFDPVHADQQP